MGGFGMGLGMGMMMGGGRRRRRMWGGGMMGGGGGGGCGSVIVMFVFLVIIMIVLVSVSQCSSQGGGAGAGVTASTIIREPLPAGSFNSGTNLITDNIGVIGNVTLVERGMRSFQDATGVRPHLYTAGPQQFGIPRPSDADLYTYSVAAFLNLNLCPGHFLLLYFENDAGEFGFGWHVGAMAQTVIDREAVDILLDFVDSYNARGQNISQIFGNAFSSGADRIMHRPMDMRPVIIVVAVVGGVVLIGFMIYNNAKRKQEEEKRQQEEAERILSQPLEKFGDEADRLAKEYED
jgi:uncharacterized membrane protein